MAFHANLIATFGAVNVLLGHYHLTLSYDNIFLVYLPLAHVLEYKVSNNVGQHAVRLRTLTLADARAPVLRAFKLLLNQIRDSNHRDESHFQRCYVCTSRVLCSSQIASFFRK